MSLAVLFGAASVVGCGGGSGSSAPPQQQPTAMPTFSPVAGTYSAAQNVTISDSTAGATIYYTTDGSVPTTGSKQYSAPLAISSTTTVSAIAIASGYTSSATATATYTINVVPQAISLPAAMTVAPGTKPLVLDSSIVTASSSCGPSAVSWSVVINDSNKATTGGTLAYWSADSSGKTWGNIYSGNTFSQNSVNTYTVTAVCGMASASSQLTVSDPAPSITALSCSPSESTSACVIPATNTETFTITGNNFIGSNFTGLNQWWGTEAHSTLGSCPQMMPSVEPTATEWVSFTEIEQGGSGTQGIGTWNFYVYNPPVSTGTGGGWNCLNNAYTVVANSSSSSSQGIVTLEIGSKKSSGTLYLRSTQTGQITWQTSTLGLGSTMAVVQGDFAYVPNRDSRTVALVNLKSKEIQTVSTGDARPYLAAVSPKDGSLYLALESNGGYTLGKYSDAAGVVALTSSGPEISDLKTDSDGRVIYLVQRDSTTELHRLDPFSGREQVLDLQQRANQITVVDGGYLVYWTGEHHLEFVDANTLQPGAEATLPLPIYTASTNYLSLSDGSLWSAQVSGSMLLTKQVGTLASAQRFSGFVPIANGSRLSFYAVPVNKQGQLSGLLANHSD